MAAAVVVAEVRLDSKVPQPTCFLDQEVQLEQVEQEAAEEVEWCTWLA
jgi:hypothetical protein